ncbi:hypothetical protein R69658_03301 [Paraburkholderia aspalathi]|uniref:Uncharacterized protein n=1 Tax=Paraburkholderia aspalathi TaxID=1324617 RepID=A0A1I6YYD5_9BURK|nr:hypothetical protein [Paraburkholderia sediminicola]CAE6746869.1 hypothetical protein R75465_02524 [Paraburkholderia aspalathi]CAE6764019.1 hypothetical protein R69658_03301 [Paraburkholderia aspalathi]SFT55181.1 hypothetical protein SAMN05192563_100217 [Paraburkholderia aspalathi]
MVGERGKRASGGLIPTISPPFAHVPRRMPVAINVAVRCGPVFAQRPRLARVPGLHH